MTNTLKTLSDESKHDAKKDISNLTSLVTTPVTTPITTQYVQKSSPTNIADTHHKNNINTLFGFKQSKVIIIDADKSVRRRLNILLQDWQCDVQCFDSVEKAILILDQQAWKPKLIISDFRLADNDFNNNATKSIQTYYAYNIPIIILISDTDPIEFQIMKDSRFTMLKKPVNAAKLRFVIKKRLSSYTKQGASA